MGQFGVGQAVRRVEDARLLTGQGRYTDDIQLDGQLYMALVRSPHAHAEIKSIDAAEARAAEGVHAVFTIADLDAAGIQDIPCIAPIPGVDGKPPRMPGHPVLARGRVRHVGDPVAAVVAETAQQAKDAAELVDVDYDTLDHVVDAQAAVQPGAPTLHEIAPDNVALEWGLGDDAAVAQAFEQAAHVTRVEMVNNRVVANSMEPRGAIGNYDPKADRFELYTSSQSSHGLRSQIAEQVLNVDPERLRVVTPDVGGGFGTKIFLYSEQVLVLHVAQALGRPVKWIGERRESFQSDAQGRDHTATMELALDAEHRMTAIRLTTLANVGGYLSNAATYVPTQSMGKMLCGLYRIPAMSANVKCVFTNTVPVDAYRGAGRPEAAYFVERTVDAAARELGLDPAELRRKNFIQPEEMPWTTPAGATYDSGEFARLLDRALEKAAYAQLAERKQAAARRGKLLGLGLSTYVEACGSVGSEDAQLRIDPDGGASLIVGTQTNGQGHHTAYAQLLADKLGLDPEQVRFHQGDTDIAKTGGGTMGSRSLLVGGGATDQAADQVIERAKKIAGYTLEVSPDDLEFEAGTFTIAGTDRQTTLAEVARAAQERDDLPSDLKGPLQETGHYDAPEAETFPNGVHVCEVEIDRETAELEITRYIVVDDFGMVLNPMLVSGQIHGGIAQGIGQALLEQTVYEADSGQLVTATYQDYTMPRADDLPDIEIEFISVPCKTNPFGIKGAGEAGAIGAPPAVINALVDALEPYGILHVDMPATTERIWQVLQTNTPQAAAE
ncbi:xanthine dehydrogenase family protein molybdopterin-binding subunit [Rhodovibrio salinarum]|uniref:Carbon monoxide dehydrogenase n=1 Tax=Rhodovibrio salinarum TaxID=1087 RepID=A0A934QLB6_9PROT|nr:xanthine dehydrogenase family protein molybdopterin-binding subunit [Rhodovibrio salinarum]MBK1698824.1 carbon monoxide dehydrogenase [Rhodovibrio salinarum]